MNSKIALVAFGMGMFSIVLNSNVAVSQTNDPLPAKGAVASRFQSRFTSCVNGDPQRAAEYTQVLKQIQGSDSYIYFCSEGDFIGRGKFETLTSRQAKIQPHQRNDQKRVRFSFNANWEKDLRLGFSAPAERSLQSGGTYLGAERSPFQSPANPGISVTGRGRGCNTVFGEFVVHDFEYDSDGSLALFSASFLHFCESKANPAMIGLIHYKAEGYAPKSEQADKCSLVLDNGQVITNELFCQP